MMFGFAGSLRKTWFLLLFLLLVLLCGCGSLAGSQAPSTSTPTTVAQQATPTPAATVQQVTPTPTTAVQQVTPTPTAAPQVAFSSYVGKWEVHGSLLTINANRTGLEQWNVGPCSSAMCNGNAHITFTQNADGSIRGTIQSVTYTQWNGSPAPTGYQPSSDDPRAGDAFQLQHSGPHLLYSTWFGARSGVINSGNRYWCDAYAVKSGWKQCGA